MGGAFIYSALFLTLSILSFFLKIVHLPLCICGEEVNCHRTCLDVDLLRHQAFHIFILRRQAEILFAVSCRTGIGTF